MIVLQIPRMLPGDPGPEAAADTTRCAPLSWALKARWLAPPPQSRFGSQEDCISRVALIAQTTLNSALILAQVSEPTSPAAFRDGSSGGDQSCLPIVYGSHGL